MSAPAAPSAPRGRIGATLERRLEALRAQRLAARPAGDEDRLRLADEPGRSAGPAIASPIPSRRSSVLADRLAETLGGEHVATATGSYVRVVSTSRPLPVDRAALATIPSLPGPDVRFVCLDTETTGLATASGTIAFLVGLGWWEGDRFEQIQLLLPDHSDEPAFLDALRELVPPDAWLVTYNGRAFDWPLLVARFRMGREQPPGLAGHLDLLPLVRRTFRHRLPDARLRTVERELLGLARVGDVDGWEIPGRYLGFLRTGDAGPLAEVVRHNDQDVRSLGRLLAHVGAYLGRPERWSDGHPGDLGALAAALRRARRHEETLTCLEAALGAWDALAASPAGARSLPARADLAGERARALGRLGRHDEALDAWETIARDGGPAAPVGWVEVAKLREHRCRDPAGALVAVESARALATRSRALGRPLEALEADLCRRTVRLQRRLTALRRATLSRSTPRPGR